MFVFLASGCFQEKDKESHFQEPFIEINDLSQNDSNSIRLEINSNSFLREARIELLSTEKELICFGYSDLKAGFNSVFLKCSPRKKNLSVLVTPSAGKTFSKNLSIKLNLKKVPSPKKGLVYEFDWAFVIEGYAINYDVYITGSDDYKVEGIIVSKFPEGILADTNFEAAVLFSRFLFDKNSSVMYVAGSIAKESILDANLSFTDSFNELHIELLYPFRFVSFINDRKLDINSFFKEKKISYTNKGENINLIFEEDCVFNDFECLQLNAFAEGKKTADLKFAPEAPWMTLSFRGYKGLFELKNVKEKEFDVSEFK